MLIISKVLIILGPCFYYEGKMDQYYILNMSYGWKWNF